MKLLETWAKAPFLKDADVLILSECLQHIYPQVAERFSEDRVVLTICPEAEENGVVYGKLASMIRSAPPKTITVLTVECSPHCYLLHAAVNEAIYIADSDIPVSHFVCLNGEPLAVSNEAVRLARYLHLVQKALDDDPRLGERLAELSLEQQAEIKRQQ